MMMEHTLGNICIFELADWEMSKLLGSTFTYESKSCIICLRRMEQVIFLFERKSVIGFYGKIMNLT